MVGTVVASEQPTTAARIVRAVGAVLIVLGILGGTVTYLSAQKTGPGLICANRAETIPAAIEGNPSAALADARLGALPARLTCTWSINGEHVVTGAYVSLRSDLVGGALLVVGVGAIVGSAASTARAHRKMQAPRSDTALCHQADVSSSR